MKTQKGNVLIIILFFLTILTVLSIIIYRISYSAYREAKNTRDTSKAYYIAKAGADLVIDNIESLINEVDKENVKDF